MIPLDRRAPGEDISRGVTLIGSTPLQRAWLPLRSAVDTARIQLDRDTFAAFVSMLGILAARLNAERNEHDWEQAA